VLYIFRMNVRIKQVLFTPGDSLLLYTDGIPDALSPSQEQFGEQRLIEATASPAPSAEALLQNIMSSIDAHIANREQYDDVTLLVVRRRAA
jgi:serine phosphatase RsbU (regulator of sigma subunit)